MNHWRIDSPDKKIYPQIDVFDVGKPRGNPRNVSFQYCRFGEINFNQFGKDEREKAVKAEEERVNEEPNYTKEEKEPYFAVTKKFRKQLLEEDDNEPLTSDDVLKSKFALILYRNHSGSAKPFKLRFKSTDVLFTSTQFHNDGGTSFYAAQFHREGVVDFSNSRFYNGRDVNFRLAQFHNGNSVSFTFVQFHNLRDVYFSSTGFHNKGSVFFEKVEFINSERVYFESTKFHNKGYLTFYSANFQNKGNLTFSSAKFNMEGEFNFEKVFIFNLGVNFSKVEFAEKLSLEFTECLFLCLGDINFSGVRFPKNGTVSFQRCHFKAINLDAKEKIGTVSFEGAYFVNASFVGGPVNWVEEAVEKRRESVPIYEVLEKRNIKKDELTEEGLKEFGNYKVPVRTNLFDEETNVSWKNISTESARNITFRLVAFHRSMFDGITLQEVNFNAPKWEQFKGRSVLHEEIKLEKKYEDELRDLENQYVQLKTNLERVGHYQDAGDFHYGEREMKRRRLALTGTLSLERFLTFLYRTFSGYGERPGRAFRMLFEILLLFTVSLMLLHIYFYVAPQPTDTPLIFSSWTDFITALREHALYLVTPFSWKKGIKILGCPFDSNWYYGFLVLFQILFYIQLPLLVMTVRRRFKR